MKPSDCKEVVDGLQEKVREYENILNEVLSKPRKVGRVTAGPLEDSEKGVSVFRVMEGSTAHILPAIDPSTKPKIGQEVVINELGIVMCVPEQLAVETPLPEFKTIDWSQIGGLKSQLQRIRETVEAPIRNAKKYAEYGISPSKGMLLYGPPGCGKTLIARAIATTIVSNGKGKTASFNYVKGPELLSRWVGATEEGIRNLFGEARTYSKKTGNRSVIFIDEADALLMQRGSQISTDVSSTIVPQFLSEMDGFDDHSPFVLLSTNLPNSLDPAVVREGRIDVKVHITRPTQEDTEDIFRIHYGNVKCSVKKEELAEKSAEYLFKSNLNKSVSGAMIATLVNDSARNAIRRDLLKNRMIGVTHTDVQEAIDILNSSTF